jgi:peroxiredoxin
LSRTLLLLLLLIAPAVAGAHPAERHGADLVHFSKPVLAPEFQAPTPDNAVLRLADYRGKVVLLNFWATWCPPCIQEMPSMQRLYARLAPQGLVVLGVSLDEDGAKRVIPFLARLKLTFPVALDPEQEIAGRYGASNLPMTFLIDPEGKVIAAAVGGRDWESPAILDYLTELLGAGSPGKSG